MKQLGWSIQVVRIVLYVSWLSIFCVYVVSMLLKGHDVMVGQLAAREAAWTFVYLFAPVLGAFGLFWFGPESNENAIRCNARVAPQIVFGMVSMTVVCHGLIYFYFYINVFSFTFSDTPLHGESFDEVVAFGFKLLLFLGQTPVLAVSYILGKKVSFGAEILKDEEA